MQTTVLEITSMDLTITVGCWSYVLFIKYSKEVGMQLAAQKLRGSFIGSRMIFLEGFVQLT
jgi:hypothetical protein